MTVQISPSVRVEEKPAKLTVLVVDDEALIRWALRRALTQRGHEVFEAGDGAAALRAIAERETPFDVVLLDYRLPDSRDSTLLATVRKVAPSAAVFMMTGYGDDEMRASVCSLGARAVIDKPFQLDVFVAMIEGAGTAKN